MVEQPVLIPVVDQIKPQQPQKVFVVALDFMPVHQKWCQYPDKPGKDESDYELWTPNGKISPGSLMGHKTTYVRRKREAQCFNNEEWDRWYFFEICECTEEDYECDLGYSRKDLGPCMPDNGVEAKVTPPEQCDGFYYITQGYRKVAGDTCKNGVNHDPLKIPCPGFSSLSRSNMFILIALFLIIIGLILATNSTVAAKCKQCKDCFSNREGKPSKHQKFRPLDGEEKGERDDEDFNKLFFDDQHDTAEPIEDKSLIDMTKKGKDKRLTSGNALEMAKKNVPTLTKPGQETNLMEFNPRS